MKSLTEKITKQLLEKNAVYEENINSKGEKTKKLNKLETNKKILSILSWLPYKDPDKNIFEVKN